MKLTLTKSHADCRVFCHSSMGMNEAMKAGIGTTVCSVLILSILLLVMQSF
jgi:hypothetical protein